MFPRDVFHTDTQLGSYVLPYGLIDAYISANSLQEFVSDCLECRLPEHCDGAIAFFERIVKADFILGETNGRAAISAGRGYP